MQHVAALFSVGLRIMKTLDVNHTEGNMVPTKFEKMMGSVGIRTAKETEQGHSGSVNVMIERMVHS